MCKSFEPTTPWARTAPNGTEPHRTPLRHCATASVRQLRLPTCTCVCDNELPNRVKLATDEELPKEAKSWL